MHHVARLTRLHDQRGELALAPTHQVVMKRRGRKQRRNRDFAVADPAIGENDERVALVHPLLDVVA